MVGSDAGRVPEAFKCFDEALELIHLLIQKHTDMPHFREELADVLNRQSRFLLARRRVSEAEKGCRRARETLEALATSAPRNPVYASLLGVTAGIEAQIQLEKRNAGAGRGLFAQAAGQFERALAIDPDRQLDRRRLEAARSQLK